MMPDAPFSPPEAGSVPPLSSSAVFAWADAACPFGVILDVGLWERFAGDEGFRRFLRHLVDDAIPVALVAGSEADGDSRAVCEGLPASLGRITPADVASPPPAPDILIEAAGRIVLPPERCVVVAADSGLLSAAHAAACQALAIVAPGVPSAEAPGAEADEAGESAGYPNAVDSLSGQTPSRMRAHFFSHARTLYADIAVNLPVDRPYTYRVPEGLRPAIRVGAIVRAPVRARTCEGVVVRLSLHTDAPRRRLKSVAEVLSPEYRVPPDLLALSHWIARYYLAGPGETLAAVSFFGLHEEKAREERRLLLDRWREWERVPLENKQALHEAGLPALTVRQAQVVRFFIEESNVSLTRAELMRKEGCSPSVIDTLVEKRVLVERRETVDREDGYTHTGFDGTAHPLLPEQQAAFDRIAAAIDERRFESFLLYGITGSGKTEVYLQAIQRVLAAGGQAIVLVPEISLTPQAVDRFRSRFGNRVGVYHSHLTRGQKYDFWRRIESGEIAILVGARSAIFAPFPRLGLIVVDEEHEHTYKQSDPAPRYHARDVAVWRARFAGIPVVLGSATPSLESYANARAGKFTELRLARRVGNARLPEIRLIDMGERVRESRETGLISEPLRRQIGRCLERGEQAILFLNRRGFSNFVICMACKTVIRCEHCDVVMTWHKVPGRLICHMCAASRSLPEVCPACDSAALTPIGMGTQRIEEDVRALFPKARLMRIDQDTASGRHAFTRMWEQISAGEADILLGTQMIAKGLHLEKVTLVGVVSADHALFLPDFRAGERAFALLTQVAGRAGRMERPGEVFVQTFMPQHYAIQRAVAHDAEGFYAQELHMREMLRFPPHHRLLLARLTGEEAARVQDRARRLGGLLRDAIARSNRFRALNVLGPVPSPIERVKDRFRWQIVIRGQDSALMRRLLYQALAVFEADKGRTGVALTLDMDPMDLL